MRRDGEKRRSFLFEDNVPLSRISTSFRNIPYLSPFIASHRCVMFFCLKNCLLFFFPLEFLYSHVLQFSLSISFALFSSPSSIFQVVPRNFLFVSRELKPRTVHGAKLIGLREHCLEKYYLQSEAKSLPIFSSILLFIIIIVILIFFLFR